MSVSLNQEWLNQNALRAYPLKEDCSRVPVDADGKELTDIVLPNTLIVDMVLTLPTITPMGIYLKQLAYVGNLITMVLADQDGNQISVVAVNMDSHVTNNGYAIAGSGDYSDAVGKIVIGDLSNFGTLIAEGIYNFEYAATLFEDSTVRPCLRGVRSLRIVSDQTESDYIFGHVKLLAGSNIRLTYLAEYNAIRIDAIDGGGMNEQCDCADEIGKNNVVRTINGIPLQDVEIVGDGQCVDVKVQGSTIVISDVCSTPCCGCPELTFITDSLKVLDSTITNLESFSQQLSERISTFVTNYILTVTG